MILIFVGVPCLGVFLDHQCTKDIETQRKAWAAEVDNSCWEYLYGDQNNPPSSEELRSIIRGEVRWDVPDLAKLMMGKELMKRGLDFSKEDDRRLALLLFGLRGCPYDMQKEISDELVPSANENELMGLVYWSGTQELKEFMALSLLSMMRDEPNTQRFGGIQVLIGTEATRTAGWNLLQDLDSNSYDDEDIFSLIYSDPNFPEWAAETLFSRNPGGNIYGKICYVMPKLRNTALGRFLDGKPTKEELSKFLRHCADGGSNLIVARYFMDNFTLDNEDAKVIRNNVPSLASKIQVVPDSGPKTKKEILDNLELLGRCEK